MHLESLVPLDTAVLDGVYNKRLFQVISSKTKVYRCTNDFGEHLAEVYLLMTIGDSDIVCIRTVFAYISRCWTRDCGGAGLQADPHPVCHSSLVACHRGNQLLSLGDLGPGVLNPIFERVVINDEPRPGTVLDCGPDGVLQLHSEVFVHLGYIVVKHAHTDRLLRLSRAESQRRRRNRLKIKCGSRRSGLGLPVYARRGSKNWRQFNGKHGGSAARRLGHFGIGYGQYGTVIVHDRPRGVVALLRPSGDVG